MPNGRFLAPVKDPARIMGKMGKIQGEIIRENPSRNPKIIVRRAELINFTPSKFSHK
jgi:hypothetical protein